MPKFTMGLEDEAQLQPNKGSGVQTLKLAPLQNLNPQLLNQAGLDLGQT